MGRKTPPYPDQRHKSVGRWFQCCTAGRLVKNDLLEAAPDLVIFHVFGNHYDYRTIIETIQNKTSADLIVTTDHLKAWPEPACRQTVRTGLETPKGCTGWLKFSQSNWQDFMSFQFVPTLAQELGFLTVPLRSHMAEALEVSGRHYSEYLSDGSHLNEEGKRLMSDIIARSVDQWIANAPTPPAPRFQETPLADTLDGKLTKLRFEGRKVEMWSPAPWPIDTQIKVDGLPVNRLQGCLVPTRTSTVSPDLPWPSLRAVTHDEDRRAIETWTLIPRDLSPPYEDVAFSVHGSLTGPDGSGRASEVFHSSSGKIRIDPEDWMLATAAQELDWSPEPGFEVTWQVRNLCDRDLSEKPHPPDVNFRRVLVQNLSAGKHEITIEFGEDALRPDGVRFRIFP